MKPVEWTEVADNVTGEEADEFLATFKRYVIIRSNLVCCNVCEDAGPHTMRYRLLQCGSKKCKDVLAPGVKCLWRGRVLICSVSGETSIAECGTHVNRSRDPEATRLTAAHKAIIREAIQLHIHATPSRIRHSMGHKLQISQDLLPPLSKVQNYANYFRKTRMKNNDWFEDIERIIHEHAYTGSESETTPFTFAADYTEDGNISAGDGSDEKPLVVGITTKLILRRLNRPAQSFVFHRDATYKTNQLGYPVLVCGVSDRCRTFHVVALFVMSQQQEPQYFKALSALQRAYEEVVQKPLSVWYLMGDGDDAQYNACQSVFGNYVHLMCFYHVIAKLVEHTKGLQDSAKHRVTRDVYDLHFSRNPQQFVESRASTILRWSASEDTKEFGAYFSSQWLSGRFHRWQCFYTPVGFATTNNPAEQFNRVLNRDYTLRSRLKLGTLLQQLLACCGHDSESGREFRDVIEASASLKRRAAELKKADNLYEVMPGPGSGLERFVLAGMKFIVTKKTERIFVPWKNRTVEGIAVSAQLGTNYAWMEVEGQSELGWCVNLQLQSCVCRYFFKFGQCIHLLLAMHNNGFLSVSGKRTMVYRGLSKKRRDTEGPDARPAAPPAQTVPPGRPQVNGPALGFQ